MNKIKVIQVGLGPVGQKITGFISQRENLEIIAAVDISPEICGKDLGVHCGTDPKNIIIQSSIKECLKNNKPDVVILSTSSSMKDITPQIKEIIDFGIPVITTCEEISYSWDDYPELSTEIDLAAKAKKVAVLGTGVNPGFLMDSLPIFLSSVCQDVQKITVHRIQDAAPRRKPFLEKIGAGLSLEQFENKKKEGTLRHVGLTQSMQMIANRIGWQLDKTEDIITPVVTDVEIITKKIIKPVGYAAGVQQIGKGYVNNVEKIILVFKAAVNEVDPYDSILIEGTPSFKSVIKGGINGDIATAAIVINAIKQIINAKPGLRIMSDMPLLSFW